jgi:hypothetical protein
VGEKNCPRPLPLNTQPEPAGYSGQSEPGISGPPGYSAHGGGYSGLERQKVKSLKFSKTEVPFDENFEVVCID